ncbi:hypothetical protein OG264_10510 [Streptomyces xanthophaeus]|uniref:hypothetical protein n=1 Tax=Streptomyces xanthophaeus TaxID=67385 RepID=UPI00386A3F1A|nr:hypothetical protein OG264_10510 [Streptomyces xanthophaeus]WST63125.1 hypothetical protein OG605_27850 [Streptomyces xanthophaeus]
MAQPRTGSCDGPDLPRPGAAPYPPGAGRAPHPLRPGPVPLRPLGPGEILGGALSCLGRHGGHLLGALLLGLLGCLPVTAALAALAAPVLAAGGRNPVPVPVPAVAALFLLSACALVTALAAALLRPSVLGRPVTAPGLLRAAAARAPAVLGAQLLVLAAVAAPPAACLAAGLPPPAPLLLAPVSLWLGVLLSLAPTAAGYEGLGPTAALRRSAVLVRGSWWRTLGVAAPGWVLAPGAAYAAALLWGPPGALLGAALLLAFPPLVSGLLYLDRRLRHEPPGEVLAAPRAGVSAG